MQWKCEKNPDSAVNNARKAAESHIVTVFYLNIAFHLSSE